MSTRKKKAKGRRGKKKEDRAPRFATIKATFFSLLAGCVVVYLAGFFFARTDGFRAYLEDQIEEHLGERIEIASSRSTLGGDLVLSGLTMAGPETSAEPLAEAKTVRVDVSYGGLFTGGLMAALKTIEISDWHVRFRADDRGQWQPAGFAVAGNWLGQWGGLDVPVTYPGAPVAAAKSASEEEKAPAGDPPALDHIAFDLKSGVLEWWVKDAEAPMAKVEGIRFAQTPLDLPTQTASHYHLHVDDATFAGHGGLRELNLEVLRTGGRIFVLDLEAERRAATARERRPEARRRYPLAAPEQAEIPSTDFDDAEALQARIRAELESAMPE